VSERGRERERKTYGSRETFSGVGAKCANRDSLRCTRRGERRNIGTSVRRAVVSSDKLFDRSVAIRYSEVIFRRVARRTADFRIPQIRRFIVAEYPRSRR